MNSHPRSDILHGDVHYRVHPCPGVHSLTTPDMWAYAHLLPVAVGTGDQVVHVNISDHLATRSPWRIFYPVDSVVTVLGYFAQTQHAPGAWLGSSHYPQAC